MEKKKILEIYRDADGNVKAEGTDSETMVMTKDFLDNFIKSFEHSMIEKRVACIMLPKFSSTIHWKSLIDIFIVA